MDFENRNSFGSVRRLRDRFEQNHTNDNINNNVNSHQNRNTTKDVFNKSDVKSSPECKQIKSIADKSFAEKLNKTLQNDTKIFNNPNFKLIKTNDNPLISSKNGHNVSPVPKPDEIEISLRSEPNPLPKPPRTFAHDVYLELKFSKNKNNSKFNNNNNNNNNSEEKLSVLYSQPNKANKWKNRLRSQSDSQVMDSKKSTQFKSNENIYDDCINTRSIDKTLKSKLMQFSCIQFKRS